MQIPQFSLQISQFSLLISSIFSQFLSFTCVTIIHHYLPQLPPSITFINSNEFYITFGNHTLSLHKQIFASSQVRIRLESLYKEGRKRQICIVVTLIPDLHTLSSSSYSSCFSFVVFQFYTIGKQCDSSFFFSLKCAVC